MKRSDAREGRCSMHVPACIVVSCKVPSNVNFGSTVSRRSGVLPRKGFFANKKISILVPVALFGVWLCSSMKTVQFGTIDGQVEAEVEAQIAADLNITWETPSTPANPDDYIIRNGLRMVRPYFFEFLAHVKSRWAGKSVVDLFAQEFRQRPREYYEDAVKLGRIQVEGKIVPPSYVVRDSEKMSHFVHRHEPPVLAGAVIVLEEGADVITVWKPASIPVHTCGQYRKNTVMGILEAEHKTGPLFPVHRLDRLVSGLLILARNARTADFFRQEIMAGLVQKQYVAKVRGVFPTEEVEVNAAVLYDPREGKSSVEVRTPADEVVAEMASTLNGTSRTAPGSDAKGKESCTRFQRLSTNGVESIVRCMPQTGRTHQIRVHLQHLGFPIANDALYLYSNVAKRSKRSTNADGAAKLTERPVACNAGEHAGDSSEPPATVSRDANGGGCQLPKEDLPQDHSKSTTTDFMVDPLCTHCPNLEPSWFTGDDEGLWLHCVRYSGTNWAYECPLPQWAL